VHKLNPAICPTVSGTCVHQLFPAHFSFGYLHFGYRWCQVRSLSLSIFNMDAGKNIQRIGSQNNKIISKAFQRTFQTPPLEPSASNNVDDRLVLELTQDLREYPPPKQAKKFCMCNAFQEFLSPPQQFVCFCRGH
jgi:hypothetical protein